MKYAFIIIGVLILAGAFFAVNVTSCMNITSSGLYTLNTSLSGAPNAAPEEGAGVSACIKIASPDVTLDCNGFAISNATFGGNAIAVLINGSGGDDVVQNCPLINNYGFGVDGDSTYYLTATNVSVFNAFEAFRFVNGFGVSFMSDNATNSSGVGFFLHSSNNSQFFSDNVFGALQGIEGTAVQGDVLANQNNLSGITSDGIEFLGVSNGYFESINNNIICNGTGSYGILAPGIINESGLNNAYVFNNSISNCSNGIYLPGSSNTTTYVANNNIYNSTSSGIYTPGSTNGNQQILYNSVFDPISAQYCYDDDGSVNGSINFIDNHAQNCLDGYTMAGHYNGSVYVFNNTALNTSNYGFSAPGAQNGELDFILNTASTSSSGTCFQMSGAVNGSVDISNNNASYGNFGFELAGHHNGTVDVFNNNAINSSAFAFDFAGNSNGDMTFLGNSVIGSPASFCYDLPSESNGSITIENNNASNCVFGIDAPAISNGSLSIFDNILTNISAFGIEAPATNVSNVSIEANTVIGSGAAFCYDADEGSNGFIEVTDNIASNCAYGYSMNGHNNGNVISIFNNGTNLSSYGMEVAGETNGNVSVLANNINGSGAAFCYSLPGSSNGTMEVNSNNAMNCLSGFDVSGHSNGNMDINSNNVNNVSAFGIMLPGSTNGTKYVLGNVVAGNGSANYCYLIDGESNGDTVVDWNRASGCTEGFEIAGGTNVTNTIGDNNATNDTLYNFLVAGNQHIDMFGNNVSNSEYGYYVVSNGNGTLMEDNTAMNDSLYDFFIAGNANGTNMVSNTATLSDPASNGVGFFVVSNTGGVESTMDVAHDNLLYDFMFEANSPFTQITSDSAYNSHVGFYLVGENATGTNLTAYMNSANGINLVSSTTTLVDSSFYKNGWEINQSASAGTLNMTNVTLGQSYPETLSFYDHVTSGGYMINETSNPSGAIPANQGSFDNYFLKILFAPSETIDNLTFVWPASVVTPSLEQSITAYTWNVSGNNSWNFTSGQAGPSNVSHSLSIANLKNFTSDDIYGLFWNTSSGGSQTTGGNPSGNTAYLVLSYQQVCPGSVLNVTAKSSTSNSAVSGATVTLWLNGNQVTSNTTGSDGSTLLAVPSSSYYTLSASASGYNQGSAGTGFTMCGATPQCVSDSDCPSTESCQMGQCSPVSCNGTVVNHACMMNQTQNQTPQCTSDSQCADSQSCQGGSCKQVMGSCGYATNHTFVKYQCGSDPSCPSCPGGQSCLNNQCVAENVSCSQSSVTVGSQVSCSCSPAQSCSIIVMNPDGSNTTLQTTNGQGQFTPTSAGEYQLVSGHAMAQVMASAPPQNASAPPPSAPAPAPTTTTTTPPADYSWLLWVALLVIVLGAGYWYWRSKKK